MNKKEVKKIYNKLMELQEKENNRMIKQNEKEKSRESSGETCFDKAKRGSKIFLKTPGK